MQANTRCMLNFIGSCISLAAAWVCTHYKSCGSNRQRAGDFGNCGGLMLSTRGLGALGWYIAYFILQYIFENSFSFTKLSTSNKIRKDRSPPPSLCMSMRTCVRAWVPSVVIFPSGYFFLAVVLTLCVGRYLTTQLTYSVSL